MGIAGSTPALSDVKFKDYENGIYVAAGSYFVTITVAGQPLVVAIDDSMGTGFNLIVSDTTD